MNRKTVVAISLGILAAAIICIIAGVVCYSMASKNAILFLIGLFMILMGIIMASVPLIILLIVLITIIISKAKNKKNGA